MTIYGFSNDRLLSEILDELKTVEKRDELKECLSSLIIIFYEYKQVIHINEEQSSYIARMRWLRGFLLALELQEKFPVAKVMVNKIHYGFNLLKLIYSSQAPMELRDEIRVAVPIPGRRFELAPIFTLYRGNPTFYEYLSICENYLERGRLENDKRITVAEYCLAPKVESEIKEDQQKLKGQLMAASDNYVNTVKCILEDYLVVPSATVGRSDGFASRVIQDAAQEFCKAVPFNADIRDAAIGNAARDLWCLIEVLKLETDAADRRSEPTLRNKPNYRPDVGNPVASGLIVRKTT